MKIFRQFNDIDTNLILSDLHIHSTWGDGKAGILQIVDKAEEMGLKQIAITEHVRSDSAFFSKYKKEVSDIGNKSLIQVLLGVEARIKNFDGELDISKEVLKKAKIKIASVHRFPFGRQLYYPDQFKQNICQEIELELAVASLDKGMCNVLGHPGGMSLRFHKEFPLRYFEEIIVSCKKNGIAFELNSAYHLPVLRQLKILLKRHNPLVSLGSDAHDIKDIGNWIVNFGKNQ